MTAFQTYMLDCLAARGAGCVRGRGVVAVARGRAAGSAAGGEMLLNRGAVGENNMATMRIFERPGPAGFGPLFELRFATEAEVDVAAAKLGANWLSWRDECEESWRLARRV